MNRYENIIMGVLPLVFEWSLKQRITQTGESPQWVCMMDNAKMRIHKSYNNFCGTIRRKEDDLPVWTESANIDETKRFLEDYYRKHLTNVAA